jgi:hypothetical protein
MLHPLDMSGRSKEPALYTEVPIREEKSLRATLMPHRTRAPIPAKWLNPQASVGKRCCNIGELIFWEIQDPGRAGLIPLKGEIQGFLNDHNENLNEHLKKREACNLGFDIFMVGRSESTSCPTLVIISSNRKSRSKVVEAIRKSGILDKYEGVLLGKSSKHPRYPDSGPAEWIASGIDVVSSRTQSDGAVYIDKSVADDGYITSGTTIYISVEPISKETSRFRKATLGGFLELRKEDGEQMRTTIVGMTAAHAFQDLHWNDNTVDQLYESDDDSFEFELDGPTPDGIFGDDSSSSRSFKSCKFLCFSKAIILSLRT